MRAKICLITGANSGIGYETAKGLAMQGHHILMVCRDQQRGAEAQQAIQDQAQNANVDLLVADLSSQKDIRRLAQQVHERYGKLDVLIHNAGGLFGSYKTSVDGFEQTFAVNYLAPFLLTQLLLDLVRASGGGRIIHVASIMQAKQFVLSEAAHPSLRTYNSMNAYRAAKTAVLMMTYHLAKQTEGSGVTVNALHPGVIYTPQSARIVPSFIRPLMKLFMQTPEQGARTSIYLATSAEVSKTTGSFFKATQTARTVPVSYDLEKQQELYRQSMLWTGLIAE